MTPYYDISNRPYGNYTYGSFPGGGVSVEIPTGYLMKLAWGNELPRCMPFFLTVLTNIRKTTQLETLRLYPPSPVMVRWTADHGQTLLIEGRTIYLPPKTTTVASLTSLHYNPKYWGETASQFLPERWAEVSSRPEGCFSAFGHGQRACLGRRFSEAEFMAVVSTVLKDYRVELRPIDQETPDMTRHRVIKALDDSTTYMTMSVGGAVPLSFVKR